MLTLICGWGFIVDDALISSRVAHHLAWGHGYRFNPTGPIVDCVTPLGWAHLLALFGGSSTLASFYAARLLSAVCWLIASAVLGHLMARQIRALRFVSVLLCMACCLPIGTWAASGMETGLAILLCTLALLPTSWATLPAGLAGALRPELVPFALVLNVTGAWASRAKPVGLARAAALALIPFVAVCIIRQIYFGRPAPLAVFAKPSDALHGLQYLWGALVLSGPTFLLMTRRWRTGLPRSAVSLAMAIGVHALVLIGVGGDWMPLWRLAVPVYPAVFLLAASIARQSALWSILGRSIATLALSLLWHWHLGADVRGVLVDRLSLITETRAQIQSPTSIASLDIGWVGALGNHRVIDLAGVTDPRVAFLPGGHTSKRLPQSFLHQRTPDTLILLLRNPGDWTTLRDMPLSQLAGRMPFSRTVENHLTTLTDANLYQPIRPLKMGKQSYVLYRRSPSP